MSKVLLEVKNLKKYFQTPKGQLHAVDNVNFAIEEGKTLGVVGESGCGKSTTGRTILRLLEATDGEIIFEGKNIRDYSKAEMKKLREEMQIIFQDPYSSLNPRLSALDIVMEPLFKENKEEAKKKALDILEFVGISNEDALKLSNTFSGGQRQRIGIARAVVTRPDFILCDEPTSALDASTQAQVINLLKDLQKKFNLTYLFISHNLGVVEYIADRIAVMYRGKLVELGTTDQIINNAQHPYTKRLLNSTPIMDPSKVRKMFEEFEVSDEDFAITGNEKLEEIEEGHFVLK